jgi:dihydrofolate synthase / folylpolyglutamate synthase
MVKFFSLTKSFVMCHGIRLSFPIPLSSSIEAIIDIFILELYHTKDLDMEVTTYKTKKIILGDQLFQILDKYLPPLKERDVVVITSKIIAICQGRVVKNDGKITKHDLMLKEADLIMPEKYVRFGVHLTIKDNLLIGSAGIDESNGNNYFILWPKDLKTTAENIWSYLRKKHQLKYLGIIITDSHSSLFRRGTIGLGLSWCGFKPLKNYAGKPDIFGRLLKFEQSNVVDSIAAATGLIMGEGNEQTPIAVASELSGVEFVERIPNKKELAETTITLETDVYSGTLTAIKWLKGGS